MSIITDALNRLQSSRAQAVSSPSKDKSEEQSEGESNSPVPAETKKKRVDSKFFTVLTGCMLVLVSIALGAYWWGTTFVSEPSRLPVRANVGLPPLPLPKLKKSPETIAENTQDLTPSLSAKGQSAEPPSTTVVQKKKTDPITPITETEERNLSIGLSAQANAQELEEIERGTRDFNTNVEKSEKGSVSTPSQEVAKVSNTSGVGRNSLGSPSQSDSSSTISSAPMKENPSSSRSSELASIKHSSSDLSLSTSTDKNTIVKLRQTTSPQKTASKHSGVKPSATKKHFSTSNPTLVSKNPAPARNTSMSNRAERNSITPEQRLVKAQLLIKRQFHQKAIDVLQPLFVDSPQTWEPWFWLGTAQLGMGDLVQAEDSFMEGLVRDDTVAYLWVQRAVVAQQRGKYGEGMDALRQAELLDPGLPEVQLNLGFNLESQGNKSLALQHYRHFLSLTEGKSTYHTVRRKVLDRVLRMGSS